MRLLGPLAARQAIVRAILERLAAAGPTEAGRSGITLPLTLDTDDPAIAGYVTALVDLLHSIGALYFDSETATIQITSVQASYVIRLLLALLETGIPLVTDWQREGVIVAPLHPFGAAVDLLAALEHRRLELTPDAIPLRVVEAALGLTVRRLPTGERAYLLHWDAAASAWQLIGGRFEERDSSLRATLLREMSEELACSPLTEGIDVALTQLGSPLHVERMSPTYGLLTRTTFAIYGVRFLVKLPVLHRELRWVTEAELLIGTTIDGQPLATDAFKHIIKQFGGEL